MSSLPATTTAVIARSEASCPMIDSWPISTIAVAHFEKLLSHSHRNGHYHLYNVNSTIWHNQIIMLLLSVEGTMQQSWTMLHCWLWHHVNKHEIGCGDCNRGNLYYVKLTLSFYSYIYICMHAELIFHEWLSIQFSLNKFRGSFSACAWL